MESSQTGGAGALAAEFHSLRISKPQMKQFIPKPKAAGMQDSYHDIAGNVTAARLLQPLTRPFHSAIHCIGNLVEGF
jgi:hypothetical protein